MTEQNISARIAHKHDTEMNWQLASDFVPMAGELIIYDIDTNNSSPRLKIGDGVTTVNNLPFIIKVTPDAPLPDDDDVIITEYTYFYDGDLNNENRTWVLNYGDIKVFAKMGELPKGTLNLVGATLKRVNPSNTWLDKTFTITEEHLTKVLHKSETDIPATQTGLIQIYDMMASDFSEFTVACICTVPGWYNVCFDDWYEVIYFAETGIYGYDKRPYGGNDYLQTFTFTASTNPSAPEGEEEDTPSTPIHYEGNEIQMFSRGICIGDSVTEGSFDNETGGIIAKQFSYPAILERITNIKIANAGIAGATSQTWYEASLNSESLWGKWVNDEWVWNTNPVATAADVISSSLNYSNFDFAIIHLGINDFGLMKESDTVDNMIANFENYINTIINKLKTDSKGIKIFLATIVPSYAPPSHAGYMAMNEKIRTMAADLADVYLLDLNTYSELATREEYKLASEIAAYISYIINTNLSEFDQIQFIEHTESGKTTIESITGTPGQFVVIGDDGKPVAKTIPLSIYYQGTSLPTDAFGEDGDLYLMQG